MGDPAKKNLEVLIPENVSFGEYANAFRVVEESSDECFLDFMVFLEKERKAMVISRVRLRKDMLPHVEVAIQQALGKVGPDHRVIFLSPEVRGLPS